MAIFKEIATHSVDLYFAAICNFIYFPGWILVLIASFPDPCILFTFKCRGKVLLMSPTDRQSVGYQ